METIRREVEFRATGRRLQGVALPYSPSKSESHNEMFMPGAIELADTVPLNIRHNELIAVAYHPGGGLVITDDAKHLSIDAELLPLPASDLALREVRAGNLRGMSIEFKSLKEHFSPEGVRVVEKARLFGLGIVADPSYETTIEARRRKSAGTARVRPMPSAIRACSCVGPSCDSVKFTADAFTKTVELTLSGKRNLALHTGSYDPGHIIATSGAGSLLVSLGASGEIVADVTVDALETPAGRALVESLESTAPIVRPLIDDAESEFTEDGNVRTYSVAAVTSLLVKVSLADPAGWDPFELHKQPPRKRRWRSWH